MNIFKLDVYCVKRGKELFGLSFFFVLSSLNIMSSMDGLSRPLFTFIQTYAPLTVIVFYYYFKMRYQQPSKKTITLIAVVSISGSVGGI